MRGIRAQFFRESVAEMSRIRHDIRFGGVPNPREATVMTRLEQISVILNSSAKNARPHAEERRSAQDRDAACSIACALRRVSNHGDRQSGFLAHWNVPISGKPETRLAARRWRRTRRLQISLQAVLPIGGKRRRCFLRARHAQSGAQRVMNGLEAG
jgi:hypothetical protein